MGSTSGFKIVPMEHAEDKKCDFGAKIYGLDMGKMTDDDVSTLRQAIQKYKVIVVKNQHNLNPTHNWELLQRLQPDAPNLNLGEFAYLFHPEGKGIMEKLNITTIPNAGLVYLVGKGFQGEDHYGLKNLNLREAFAGGYYSKPLKKEDFERGVTRWQSWHMDGPLYKLNPPMFSSFRIIRFPRGEQDVDWADGSGLRMKVQAGRTAFVSTSQLYDLLSDDERRMADHSWVEYMMYPYDWNGGTRGNPNGLGNACEGREKPAEEMGRIRNHDPAWVRRHPMVWVNPATGERSLQVQQNCVRRLFLRDGPGAEARVVDDIKEVREILTRLQLRVIRPEYIYSGPEEEGDTLLWYNWGLMHTRVDYPESFGVRSAHQAWIPSAAAPVGPTPMPVTGS